MRILCFALLAAAVPAAALPAPANAAPLPTDRLDQAAGALQNPLVQDGIARALTQLAGIVLDTKVGPLATLADPQGDVRPGDTLGDVARRSDPDVDRHVYDSTRGAVATAGAVAGGVSGQMAEIDRTAGRLTAALAPLMAILGSRDTGAQ
jgi:hypothetical protein